MPRRDEIPGSSGQLLSDRPQGTGPDLFFFEQQLWQQGITRVAGVDEAGRGPLAGPVVAAAVVFEPGVFIDGVNDSKKLSSMERNRLFEQIRERALAFGVGIVSPEVIDEINILQATMLAMKKAVAELNPAPMYLLVDGNYYTNTGTACTTIVKGDSLSISIAAASILAKVTRDRMMEEFDAQYPVYGFAGHKGYGTAAHVAAIGKYGRSPIHRKSFHVASLDDGSFQSELQETIVHV